MKKGRRKKLLFIILFISIILVIIFLKNNYSQRLLYSANFGVPSLIQKKEIDYLFLGSSAFRQGLDPYMIEKNLGDDFYILTYNGNQPAFEVLQLNYLLDKGLKIKKLYVDMYAYELVRKPWVSDTKQFLEMDLMYEWAVWKMIRKESNASLNEFWQIFVSANNEQLLTWPVTYPVINNRFYKGGNIAESLGKTKRELEQIGVERPEDDINLIQVAAIEELIKIANENGIEICFIETPKFYSVMQDEKYQYIMGRFIEMFDKTSAKLILAKETYDNTTKNVRENYEIVPFNNEEDYYFSDTVHMSSLGRKKYTEELVKKLQ